MKTIETANYVGLHKEKVLKFTELVGRYVSALFNGNQDIKNFMDEAYKRALSHDNDKLNKYRTLELYSNRDELETDEEKEEYTQSHKFSQRHHVQFYLNSGEDMKPNDIFEFMGDIYSSTLLRGKKAYDELLEERDVAKFPDYYLEIILNTYGLVNNRFKQDVRKQYPNLGNRNIIDYLRSIYIKNEKMPKFINSK